jgi:hypothetical protein
VTVSRVPSHSEEIISSAYFWQKFMQLHHGYVFTHTASESYTERSLRGIQFEIPFFTFHPSLWLELIRVWSIQREAPLHAVRVGRYLGIARNEMAVDGSTFRGRYTDQKLRRWREKTQALFDAGHYQREMLACLFVPDGGGQMSGFLSSFDLRPHLGEYIWVRV